MAAALGGKALEVSYSQCECSHWNTFWYSKLFCVKSRVFDRSDEVKKLHFDAIFIKLYSAPLQFGGSSGALNRKPVASAGEAGGAHVAHPESPGRVPGGAETGWSILWSSARNTLSSSSNSSQSFFTHLEKGCSKRSPQIHPSISWRFPCWIVFCCMVALVADLSAWCQVPLAFFYYIVFHVAMHSMNYSKGAKAYTHPAVAEQLGNTARAQPVVGIFSPLQFREVRNINTNKNPQAVASFYQ